VQLAEGVQKQLVELLEEFYSALYAGHDRVDEWRKDKSDKHRAPQPLSATELKRLQLHYEKKAPVALPAEPLCPPRDLNWQ